MSSKIYHTKQSNAELFPPTLSFFLRGMWRHLIYFLDLSCGNSSVLIQVHEANLRINGKKIEVHRDENVTLLALWLAKSVQLGKNQVTEFSSDTKI